MEIGKWEAIHSNWGCYHPMRQVEVVCFHGLFAGEKVSKLALSSTDHAAVCRRFSAPMATPSDAGLSPRLSRGFQKNMGFGR